MCVTPYIARHKDGTIVPVPCGHCLECRKAYQAEWTFRLKEEAKRTLFPAFITLTYNVDHIRETCDPLTGELQPCVCKRDWQLFMKRLRKLGDAYLVDARYFAIGEYGAKFNRPHMHAILICPHIPNIPTLRQLVEKAWCEDGQQIGFVKVEFARFKQMQYVCKYMNKIDNREHLVKPWRLFSRSLGLNFLSERMVNYYLTTFDRTCINDRVRIGLPRYYRLKLNEFAKQLNPWFAKYDIEWSQCLGDYQPKENTMAWFCKDFVQHIEKYRDLATISVIHTVDGKEFEQILQNPTRKDIWNAYVGQHKELQEMQRESARILFDAAIRNKIESYKGFDSEIVNVKILQE